VDTEQALRMKHMSAAVVQLDGKNEDSDEENSPKLVAGPPETLFAALSEKKEISAICAAYKLGTLVTGTESQPSCLKMVRRVSSAIFCLDTGDEIASKSLDSTVIPNVGLERSQVGGSEGLDSRGLALDFSYHSTSKDKVDVTEVPFPCGPTSPLLESAHSTSQRQHGNPILTEGDCNRLLSDQSYFHEQPQPIKAIDSTSGVDASHRSTNEDLKVIVIPDSQEQSQKSQQATNSQYGEAGSSFLGRLSTRRITHATSTRLNRPTRKICRGSRPAVEQKWEFNVTSSEEKMEEHQASKPCEVNIGDSSKVKESCVLLKKTARNPYPAETVSKARSRQRKVSKNASHKSTTSSRRLTAADRAKVKMTALKKSGKSQFHSEGFVNCNLSGLGGSNTHDTLRGNASKAAPETCDATLPFEGLISAGESQHLVPNVINLLKPENTNSQNMQKQDDREIEVDVVGFFGPNTTQQNNKWNNNEIEKPDLLWQRCPDGDITMVSNISIDNKEAGISSDNLSNNSRRQTRPVRLNMARKPTKILSRHDFTTSKNLEVNTNITADICVSDAMDIPLNQQTSTFAEKKYRISHQISQFMSRPKNYGKDSCSNVLSRLERITSSLGGTSELLEVIQSKPLITGDELSISTPTCSSGNCDGDTCTPRKAVNIQSNSIHRKDNNAKGEVADILPYERVVNILSNKNTSDSSGEQNGLAKSPVGHPSFRKPIFLDRKRDTLKRPIEGAEPEHQEALTMQEKGRCVNSITKRIRSESNDSNVTSPKNSKTPSSEKSEFLPSAIHPQGSFVRESMVDENGSPRSRVRHRKSTLREVRPVTGNAKQTRNNIPNALKQLSSSELNGGPIVRNEVERGVNDDENEISELRDRGVVQTTTTPPYTLIPLSWERLGERFSPRRRMRDKRIHDIRSPDSVNRINQAKYQESSVAQKANSKQVKFNINMGRTVPECGLPPADCF
jgi:hypothetical protein